MGTNCSARGGHFHYWVEPKSFWVQKDWLDGVVVNCIYLCDFSKSTELFTYRYFPKVLTPPGLSKIHHEVIRKFVQV